MSVQNSQGSGGLKLKKQRSGKFQFGYQLNVRVYDIDFEPGVQDEKDKDELGFYIYRNMKFIDCCDLESPHVVMVPLRSAKPIEVVRVIVQNQDDDTFYGSISLPLKKYFLNDTIVKNHEHKQWITLFDDVEDDEYDGDLEEDDLDHPKVLVSFAITECEYGPGGEVVEQTQASLKTAEIDQSSMVSPPRDIDMTSQIEGSENGALHLEQQQMMAKSVVGHNEEQSAEEFKEFRKHSTHTQKQTTTMVTSSSAVITSSTTTNIKMANEYQQFQKEITEVGVIEEGDFSSEKKKQQSDENTNRSHNIVQQNNNFMEVTETRGVTTDREHSSGSKQSPAQFKQTDMKVIEQTDVIGRPSNEFKTKSGIKSNRAFIEEQTTHVVTSTYGQQDHQQLLSSSANTQQVEFHPQQQASESDTEEEQLEQTQNVPSAASRPSLPAMNSERSQSYSAVKRQELGLRSQQFSDLDEKLGLQKQVSINTAAEHAKHKRSVTTGMLRMQAPGAIDPEHLSFLFGGSAKPKMATEKVNILKEKEKAMAWIKDESKKYDLDVLKQDLTSQIQTTVYNIKKEQKDSINDEKRQVARLDKIDQFHIDLVASKTDVDTKSATIAEMSNKALQSFSQFDEARQSNMDFIQTELSNKKKELQDVKDQEASQNAENNRQKLQIKNQRQKNSTEGIGANPECLQTMNYVSDAEKQLIAARKKNLGDVQKTKQLRSEFDQLKTSYQSQVDDLRQKLSAENQKREGNQIESIKIEQDLIKASKTNFELKTDVYQKEIDWTKLENKKQQANRNIALLNEKKKQLDAQLATAQKAEDTQTKKLESDISTVNSQLTTAKSECENTELKLQDLQAKNDQAANDDWERKLKALQTTFDKKEQERQDTQNKADQAMADMGAKLNVFKDPFLDRASETETILNQIKAFNDNDGTDGDHDSTTGAGFGTGAGSGVGSGANSGSGKKKGTAGLNKGIAASKGGRKDMLNDLLRTNDDIKTKADRLNDLAKRKNDLDAKRKKRQGLDELRSGLQNACGEYDKMADDLEQQVSDISEISKRVSQAIEDRSAALDQQIGANGELSLLKGKKRAQDRELIDLQKEIEQLSKHSDRYRTDIRNLQDEKDILCEHIDQLDQLVQAREADLAQVEAELEACNQQVEWLQSTIIQQGKNKKPAKLFTGKKGDMLDELLGNYINETGCPVPIQRLGNGFYMFGTKKIFAKVLNGRLVIRVGGGFMVIEEFIQAYAEQEMRKKKHKEDQEAAAAAGLPPPAPPGQSPRNAKGGKVLTAVADTRLAGTTRSKRFTEAQLKSLQAHGGVRVVNPHH